MRRATKPCAAHCVDHATTPLARRAGAGCCQRRKEFTHASHHATRISDLCRDYHIGWGDDLGQPTGNQSWLGRDTAAEAWSALVLDRHSLRMLDSGGGDLRRICQTESAAAATLPVQHLAVLQRHDQTCSFVGRALASAQALFCAHFDQHLVLRGYGSCGIFVAGLYDRRDILPPSRYGGSLYSRRADPGADPWRCLLHLPLAIFSAVSAPWCCSGSRSPRAGVITRQ